jgi:hypothetical protein
LDEHELKRHRQESLTQMPKIIPLELLSVSSSSESAAAAAADEAEKENMMMGGRAEEAAAAGGPGGFGLAIDLGDMAGEEEDHEEEDEPMEQDERMDQQVGTDSIKIKTMGEFCGVKNFNLVFPNPYSMSFDSMDF